MEAIEVEVEGQKRDERGRQLRSAEEWEQLMALYRESGLTQKAFAKREGLKYATFVAWLGRLRRKERAPESVSASPVRPAFATLRLGGMASSDRALEVALPDGTRLRGDDPSSLAALVKALQATGR